MREVLSIISIVLYSLVGLVCLTMANKTLFAKEYLPFHQQATGQNWGNFDNALQSVILTTIKISGLGFLIVGLLLIVVPIANYFINDIFLLYLTPVLAIIFCYGLYIFNYGLYNKTKTQTPWMGAIMAMIVIAISFIISII